jgi:hypothetical protein
LGTDRSNTGAMSFTSSALARPSDAPRNKIAHSDSSVRYLDASAFAY